MNEAKRLLSDWCYMNCDAPPRPPEIAQIVETAYSVLDNGKQNSNAYSPRVPFESPILVHAAKPKTKLEWALAHARMGFNVFPLKPNSKKPLIERWQIAATGNEAKIREWWTRNPDANIGINTDGLLVLDVDSKHHGIQTFQQLALVEDFPKTRWAKTKAAGRTSFIERPGSWKGSRHRLALPSGLWVRFGRPELTSKLT